MPTRSAQRNQNKRLARLKQLSTAEGRKRRATLLLLGWQAEARRRARDLGAPAAWALTRYPSVLAAAWQLDPSGELLAELHRVCAEAVAEFAGRHLLGGSRPLADRRRRVKPAGHHAGEAVNQGGGPSDAGAPAAGTGR
jgi:hypothetical protein